ncbi:hypothetical protein Tco_0428876 [Tanacetum coccineum]
MAEYSHKWHNGTSSRTRSTKTFDGLAAIQTQLNNLKREIKKVNEKVYAAQVGCELSIRNQGDSIKTLEIQIGQLRKVLQERGFENLPRSMETDPRDQVKLISTAKANFSKIRRFKLEHYAFISFTATWSRNLSHARTLIIFDIPEDDDVPLILGQPFLSTAHSKIDVFKRKITLREPYGDLAKTMIWFYTVTHLGLPQWEQERVMVVHQIVFLRKHPHPELVGPMERITKKRTKNKAKTTKPDSEWKRL